MQHRQTILVIRAQQRRTDAFERLMALHERPLLYYIRRQLGDADRAWDVSQEVWLSVWKSIPRLKDPHAFHAWLYQIAHRRMALEYRRRQAHQWQNEKDIGEEDLVGPDAPVDVNLQVGELHGAIDKLSPRLREVVILRYIAQLTVDDITLAIGCPAGTVRSRLHYARKELKQLLEGEHDHD